MTQVVVVLHRRRRASIRVRLTLIAAAAVAVVALVVCGVTWFTLRQALLHQADRELDRIASGPVTTIDPTEVPDIPVSPLPAPGDIYVQALLPDGRTFQWPNGSHPLPVSAADRAVAVGTQARARYTVDTGQGRYRVLALPGPHGSTIQIARSLAETDSTLQRVGLIMLAVVMGAVTSAALAGRLVAHTGLQPVNRLTRAATRIARTQDLQHPIPVDGRDEIAQVSAAFNTMIAALDTSRKAQQELIEDAAHELRTPMSSMRTNIDLLVHAGQRLPDDDRQALVADLHRQAVELSDLIADLVNLARFAIAEEAPVPIAVADVVTSAIDRATARNPQASFDYNPQDAVLVVHGQYAALERAVVNLLDNAVKFGPPGQVVEVRVARVVVGGAEYAEIAVADRAAVIPEAERQRVFNRFHRLADARGIPGSGLGLAIVQQTAAAHGGTVTVAPRGEGGNVFRLRIPAV